MIKPSQFQQLQKLLVRANQHSSFYRTKFAAAGFNPDLVQTPADVAKIPFSSKDDLREAYPLGIMAVPEEEIVRIHSSSGTTGKAVIIPYTKRDIEDWAIMFARCYEMAGITNRDRIQITPGYGLWTAGIGFQAGAERLGAMAVPMGPGNTEKQLTMMLDLQTTVLASTSSYALLLAEKVQERGLLDKIALKRGIIGSERWSDKMRERIHQQLGIELFDIYGLTECYGPGISIDCAEHSGMHYWDDYLYFEIIDPLTGENLPDGEYGELVITTLVKEGAPLIRYRTRDITRLIPGKCPCGSPYPRHDRIMGRSDDMIKVKGVNIYPGQIDDVLRDIKGLSSEYQIILEHTGSKDIMQLRVEVEPTADKKQIEQRIMTKFKQRIGILILADAVDIGVLPRSEKKTQRVIDNRYN